MWTSGDRVRVVQKSVSQRTLLQIGASMTVVILLATTLTYLLTFSALEERSMIQIRQYTEERVKREEMRFVIAQENHSTLHRVLLDRLDESISPEGMTAAKRRFDELLVRTDDGAMRSRRELGQGEQHTTTWIHKDTELTDELRYRIVMLHELCEQFFPAWRPRVESLYISAPERFNTGFDPLFPQWVWSIDADWDQSKEEWARIASLQENPGRVPRWSGVTVDPTTTIPIVTLSTPVDFQGRHVATLHHDISLKSLVQENLHSDHAGMKHFIFRDDGLLIAHPDKLTQLVKSGGRFNIAESQDRNLKSLYRAATMLPDVNTARFDQGSNSYFAVSRMAGPGWYFLTKMPREKVRKDAFGAAQWVLWTGLSSLALVLLLQLLILRREIAQPLGHLMAAVERVRRGEPSRASLNRPDELGRLGEAFDQMSEDVATRDAELRQANQELESRVAERTEELTHINAQLERAREETLALLSRERELSELKSSFVSLVSHEVRTPLGVIQSSADILDRYKERLSVEQQQTHFDTIFRSVKNLSELVEGVLMLGRIEDGRMQMKPQAFDLGVLCAQIVDEIASATGRAAAVKIDFEELTEPVHADPDLLRHIFFNLLSNAIKYSPESQVVEFSMVRSESSCVFVVRDSGIGIPQEDVPRLFQSLARGSNVGSRPGTGLGLLIVQRCVQAHGGTIEVESEIGRGTTVKVELPLFVASSAPSFLESRS